MANSQAIAYTVLHHVSEDLTFTANSLSQFRIGLASNADGLIYYPKFEKVMQRESRRFLTYRASMPIDEIVLNLQYFNESHE